MEVCTVQSILGKRVTRENRVEYLVRWEEYPAEEGDTWEPESQL